MLIFSKNIIFTVVIFILWPSVSHAVKTTQLFFMSGWIIDEPPCVISNDNIIQINFGDAMRVSDVNGVNSRSQLIYTVRCEATAPFGKTLNLRLDTTTPAIFDPTKSSIQTTLEGLAIQIYQDNQPMVLGKPVLINLTSPPVLEAVPIKDPNIKLRGGAFEAAGTLVAEYY